MHAGYHYIYCVVVLGLVVFLKMWPSLAIWSLIPLTLMGLLTSWTVILRKQFNDQQYEREVAQAEENEVESLRATLDKQRQEHEQELDTLRNEHRQIVDDLDNVNQELSKELDNKEIDIVNLTGHVAELERQLSDIQDGHVHAGGLDIMPMSDIQNGHNHAGHLDITPNVQDFGPDNLPDANHKRQGNADQRRTSLLDILRTEFDGMSIDVLNKEDLGRRLGTTGKTIGRDLSKLEGDGAIVLNGIVEVI